jgi:HK97 family phage prohead protease
MKKEYKRFDFKVTDADDSKGIIRGYASTFGNVDLGNDVVDAGAFKKTIQESKGKIPILMDHDPKYPMGWNLRAEEDAKGLFVEGEVNQKISYAKDRYEWAKQAITTGGKMGLSIGYSVVKAIPDKEVPMIRRLKEMKLWEYSFVVFPMNTQAAVTSAKFWSDTVNNEAFLDFVKEESKTRGIDPKVFADALQGGAAAGESEDPAFCQSLDRYINLFKGVSK